jgi:hypothetical protein
LSKRVQQLRADAVAILTKLKHGVALTEAEALLFARAGSLKVIDERLQTRLQVQRIIPGESVGDTRLQRRLAIVELATEFSGAFDSDDRSTVVRNAVEQEAALARRQRQANRENERITDLLRQMEQHGPAFRAFCRDVYRLLSEQRRAILDARIDDSIKQSALADLDAVYERHLATAARYALPQH